MTHSDSFSTQTPGRSLIDVTASVRDIVNDSKVQEGLANVFIHHTSASIMINENADPNVQKDLEAFFSRLIKDGDPLFLHDDEGPDDMPSHIRSALTATSISIPIAAGKLLLGTWQGLFLWEHRYAAHVRKITVTVVGE